MGLPIYKDTAENLALLCDFNESVRLDHNNPALTEDIAKNGVKVPLEFLGGKLCCGYCRLASALTVDPKMEVPYVELRHEFGKTIWRVMSNGS